jgi:hypothetical protein
MTQQEFFLYTELYPNRVNVWYSNTSPYTINGISIPVLTPSPGSVDLRGYLQQVTEITIPLVSGGSVTLDVQTSNFKSISTPSTATGVTEYYIYTTLPVTIPGQGTQSISNGIILISPGIIVHTI